MAGYVPLFDSIATGTLYGKWPDIGVWPLVLALADKNGRLDVSPEFFAGVTGLPVSDVSACMKRFCLPDPGSRSKEHGGARLVPIDPDRDWGWVIVNHGKYKEKARLMSRDKVRTESGEDAARKALSRSPPKSPAIPPSDSYADTNKEKNPLPPEGVVGLDLESWNRFLTYRREIRKPIKPVSIPAAQRKLAGFGAHQAAVVEQTIANSWSGLFEIKLNGKAATKWE